MELYHGLHKNIKHQLYSTYNKIIIKKCIEQQIIKLERFLKDHVTLKLSYDAENSALPSQEEVIF